MVPSGPPGGAQLGGAAPQSAGPSLLRSSSGILTGGVMPSQSSFSSLASPRSQQYNNMNMLGNVSSLVNGGANSGLSGPGNSNSQISGGIDTGAAESDQLHCAGNEMGFSPASSSFAQVNSVNSGSSGLMQLQGQQFCSSSGQQQQSQQLENNQNVQHGQHPVQQLLAPLGSQLQQSRMIRGGFGGGVPLKMESQVSSDQNGQLLHQQQQQQLQQHLQSLRGISPVKLEPQHLQAMRSLAPVKLEQQHSGDQSSYLHQQQQQQLLQMSMSRQSSQAATSAQLNLLHQQRLMQLQQQQQSQLLKGLPQQRSQLQPQFQTQNLSVRSSVKPAYEPGMCARRLTHYMYQQQHRPEDNNIDFWRKFVAEYFTPNAKKKWCVSMYGSGRQTTGVFPQDAWRCEICNRRPGRGFEATFEVLPRLFKIKYESGTLEELLYVDMPREYHNSSGQIILDYAKAIQESVFEQLRVVRDGQLRIVFSQDLKICSWEFCARRHEELIPRRLLIPQVSQLGSAAQKYQAATQNATSSLSLPDLQSNCNMFVASARQLVKTLEVPLVNDLGYTKRYVRCLQISEVVNSMKDLIDYSRITGAGPMESLAKYPGRTSNMPGPPGQNQQPREQQQQAQQHVQQLMQQNPNPGTDQTSAHTMIGTSSPRNTAASTVAGFPHQNLNPMSNVNSPYGGSCMPSPTSSSTMQQVQSNHSPFHSPTPSSSNNHPPQGALAASNHMSSTNSPTNLSVLQSEISGEGDATDSQSSVQKFIQEMMMSSQLNGTSNMMGIGSLENDAKNLNGSLPSTSNSSINGPNRLNGLRMSQSSIVNGIRAAVGNIPIPMNGRAGISSIAEDRSMSNHQDMGNQLLSGLGTANGFSNLQFDWKPSP